VLVPYLSRSRHNSNRGAPSIDDFHGRDSSRARGRWGSGGRCERGCSSVVVVAVVVVVVVVLLRLTSSGSPLVRFLNDGLRRRWCR
jgi:hypothetical protein